MESMPIQCGIFERKTAFEVTTCPHSPDFSIIELASYEDGLASTSLLSIGDGSACFGVPWRVTVWADGDSIPPGGGARRIQKQSRSQPRCRSLPQTVIVIVQTQLSLRTYPQGYIKCARTEVAALRAPCCSRKL
ncbi:uncharacterized protein STEHIDRAFT_123911, partial [Stereum hirsutum FP-91666 SS1]|uniref:uncharacterized protein n=1 Tax=Stereum hirsutum (strain FP-91666) TaxID=721885 RepID=UPI000444A729